MLKLRIIADIALIVCIAVLPWWLWLPLLAFSALYFPFFWEAIIIAAVADALYGDHARSMFLAFPFAAAAFLLVVLMIPLRERFRN